MSESFASLVLRYSKLTFIVMLAESEVDGNDRLLVSVKRKTSPASIVALEIERDETSIGRIARI